MQPVPQTDHDPLGMTPEQMRELGYRTVDLLVSQLADDSIPAMRRGAAGDLRARLGGSAPPAPREWGELLEQVEGDVLSFMSRLALRVPQFRPPVPSNRALDWPIPSELAPRPWQECRQPAHERARQS